MSKLDPPGSGKRKHDEGSDAGLSNTKVRYLGKGDRAIIRPGVVMVAPGHESSHFLMKSAIFVYGVGVDGATGEHVTRGVIIDHPTAFTMGEMGGGSVVGVLGNNVLFRGGDAGNDSALLLHCHGDKLATSGSSSGGDGDSGGDSGGNNNNDSGGTPPSPIGNSGLYEGGLQSAMDAADDGIVSPDDFKFFFNYVQFTDNEIEGMLHMEDSAGDAWMSVEVPPDFVLNSDYGRGEAWTFLRNKIQQMLRQDEI